jgi:hypothetical protein
LANWLAVLPAAYGLEALRAPKKVSIGECGLRVSKNNG